MKIVTPSKLLALGIILMIATIAVACGNGNSTAVMNTPTAAPATPTDTPIPATEPTVAATVQPPGVTTAPITEDPTLQPPDDEKVELRVIIMKRSADDLVTVLEKGGVLTSKDFYGFVFEPAEEAWVYIMQQDSTTAIDVLFPNPAFSEQTNPVAKNTAVWIPKDINSWFRLDQNVGAESFFVVASSKPMEELENIISAHDRDNLLGPLAGFLGSGSRGVGDVVTLDKEPKVLPNGSQELLDETVLQGDGDNFVYSLEFMHE